MQKKYYKPYLNPIDSNTKIEKFYHSVHCARGARALHWEPRRIHCRWSHPVHQRCSPTWTYRSAPGPSEWSHCWSPTTAGQRTPCRFDWRRCRYIELIAVVKVLRRDNTQGNHTTCVFSTKMKAFPFLI